MSEKKTARPKEMTIVSTIPTELYDRLKQAATDNDRSISKEIKRIIGIHFDNIDSKDNAEE